MQYPMNIFLLSSLIRTIVLIFGHFQDQYSLVPYTDIDYNVFTHGAQLISQGLSPYDHPTYRYSPLLALLLLPNIWVPSFGKVLFCCIDQLSAFVLQKLVPDSKFVVYLFLFNPIMVNISTRGNADSLICFLLILFIKNFSSLNIVFSGLVFGFAVYWRIFPVILALTVILNIYYETGKFFNIVLFLLVSFATFCLLCTLFEIIYPNSFKFSILFHLTRSGSPVDYRHNFSIFWLSNFLTLCHPSFLLQNKLIHGFSLLIQLIIHLAISLKYYNDFIKAFYLHIVVFVFLSKVYTVQYFSWYFAILPLILFDVNRDELICVLKLKLSWILSFGMWLLVAFSLEFKGINTFDCLYLCSIVFSSTSIIINFKLIEKLKKKSNKLSENYKC
ncbi:hypothetical protein P9112_004915 [Eukaryota sp. TZLM1-RC]